MHVRAVPANTVRIPEPVAGEALVVERYGKPYAVIIDGEDFALYRRMMELWDRPLPIGLRMTEAGAELHRLSEAGEAVEEFDPALLDAHPPVSADGR
jgi:PHD/YefM family antitoxin component YafN of YafNO toxin-antitoxin module